MSDVRRIYWDSCVVIDYLSGTAGRAPIIKNAIDEVSASKGGSKIIISQVAKVEVAYVASEKGGKVSKEAQEKIDLFWNDDSVIELIEFGEHITIPARDLIRMGMSKGWRRLKPMDAIHLATAVWAEVAEFHTYDVKDFEAYAEYVKFTICEPAPKAYALPLGDAEKKPTSTSKSEPSPDISA